MAAGEPEPELALDLDRALSSVQEAIDRERGVVAWLRSRPTRVRLALAAGAITFGLALGVSLGGTWALLEEVAASSRPLILVGYIVLLGATLRSALRPMQQTESVTTALVLSALGLMLPFAAAALPLHDSHEIVGQSGYCVILGTFLAGGLVALMRWLDRGGHSNRRSALLAVAAAAMGSNLALEFHCPITRFAHRAAFHASVGVVILLALLAIMRLRPSKPARESR